MREDPGAMYTQYVGSLDIDEIVSIASNNCIFALDYETNLLSKNADRLIEDVRSVFNEHELERDYYDNSTKLCCLAHAFVERSLIAQQLKAQY